MGGLWIHMSSAAFLFVATLFAESAGQCSLGSPRVLTAMTNNVYSFTSPNYPSQYPANASCSWLLRSSTAGTFLKIVVTDLKTEQETHCNFDRLEIFDGDSMSSPRLSRLCGSSSYANFNSTGASAFVSFTSDGSQQSSGFNIAYIAVLYSKPSVPPPMRTTTTTWLTTLSALNTGTTRATSTENSQCPGENAVTGLQASTYFMQYLTFSGYQLDYLSKYECGWLIQAYTGQEVHLTISYLQLDYDLNCNLNSLTIFDAAYPDIHRSLAKLCTSYSVRRDFYSTGQNMYLLYKTNVAVKNGDFQVGYESTRISTTTSPQGTCVGSNSGGVTLIAESFSPKYIESPGYPSYYPNNADCAWHISASDGLVVHVQVINMMLDSSVFCSFDAVTLYDDIWASNQIAKLCTNSASTDYYSSASNMYVTFKSDKSGTNSGFRLSYEAAFPSGGTTTPSPSSSRAFSVVGVVSGVVVGAIVFSLFCVCITMCVRRRRSAASQACPTPTTGPRPVQSPGHVYVTPASAAGPGAGRHVHTDAGYSPTEFYDPPPAYMDLRFNGNPFPAYAQLTSVPSAMHAQPSSVATPPPSYSDVIRMDYLPPSSPASPLPSTSLLPTSPPPSPVTPILTLSAPPPYMIK